MGMMFKVGSLGAIALLAVWALKSGATEPGTATPIGRLARIAAGSG